jgi:predicted Fe-Mo cluster-binding NifX family protein
MTPDFSLLTFDRMFRKNKKRGGIMKIAISATDRSLDAKVDPRFGRCTYFIVVDPETMEFEVIDNSGAMAAGGAGVSAAQAVVDKNVQALLTGNCGPNAYQVLSSAGIQLITGVSGKIRDVAENYGSGKYQVSTQANVPDHFGMGAMPAAEDEFGMGQGRGKGRGMGQGRGKGRGMGQGMGRGQGPGMASPTDPSTQQPSSKQELQELKAQSQAMAQQLSDIQDRIKELEGK